ncbi:MAG TPA: hypothetical protein VJP78_01335, partial [Thermoleophilia bacterium]|nr:hypothetical protein [Thermoleophilia bacterium]
MNRPGVRRLAGRSWIISALAWGAFIVLPFIVMGASPGLDHDAFATMAKVDSRLAETLNGKLEFFLVSRRDGRAPADRFVLTIDHGYTAGIGSAPGSADNPGLIRGELVWLQGSLMDRETYFGEQYLFFGYPQLYVSQVKSGLLWPSQLERLGRMYLSPVTGVGSGYVVWVYPFIEEYSLGTWLLWIGRFVLLVAAIAGVIF